MKYNVVGKDIEVKIHNYDCVPNILIPNPKVIQACNEISDSWQNIKNIKLYFVSKRETKANAKKFMCQKFKLHRIFYKNHLNDLDVKVLKNVNSIDACLRINSRTGLYISPFLLPVSFCAADSTGCMVVENVNYIKDDYYLENMKVSFRGIHLQQNVSEITESSYVHELAHTQTLSVKGSIREYYNSEVISIFLELLNVYEEGRPELMKINDTIRLSELFNNLNVLDFAATGDIDVENDELLSDGKYAISIPKAYCLLIEYINGTPALRRYILRSIQNIFDGNLQLEDLLDEFEINFDSCFEDQKLLKYFCH
ncbi:MAG: hypothetical protein K2H20_01620 [Bacilli bacterium]|nr:hypothetical protein [Bacilli bacterium]